jgi:hypothetical protein
MQPGSQRLTSELNSNTSDLSDSAYLRMGWLDIQHKHLERACMSGLVYLPSIGDAFVNNRSSHVSGDVEGCT